MISPITDGKMLANAAYYSVVIRCLAMGYACLGKMIFKGTIPKLNFTGCDIGMVVLDVSLAVPTKGMLIKQGIIPADILKWSRCSQIFSTVMAVAVVMILGGAVANAAAFSGGSDLVSWLSSVKAAGEESKHHDKATEQLQAAQASQAQKRMKHLDWINDDLRSQGHIVQTFHDVDAAIDEYNRVTVGNNLKPFGAKPTLADFYKWLNGQKDCEILFIIIGMSATGLLADKLSKKP